MKIQERLIDGESEIGVFEDLSQVESCSITFERFPYGCNCYDSITLNISFRALNELKTRIIAFQKQFVENHHFTE